MRIAATKSVLQCPVGGEQMTRQRTMPGARRTRAAPGPSTSTWHAKLTACADHGSANRSRGNTLFCASTNPGAVARYFASFAHSPTPATRCAARPLNQRLHVLGAVQLTGVDVDTLQRPAQVSIAASRTHRIARWPRHTRAARSTVRVWLCAALLDVRAYLAQSPQRFSLAFNRCIGRRSKRLRTLFIS